MGVFGTDRPAHAPRFPTRRPSPLYLYSAAGAADPTSTTKNTIKKNYLLLLLSAIGIGLAATTGWGHLAAPPPVSLGPLWCHQSPGAVKEFANRKNLSSYI